MRLFIGTKIEFENLGHWPDHLRKLKQSFGKRNVDIRWTAPLDYHITLAFLGEQDESAIKPLTRLIDEIAGVHAPINTDADGMGGFPGIHSSRVIWLGIHNKRNLRYLQTNLMEKLSEQGFPSSADRFIPHMTIGRLRNLQSVKSLIDPHLRKNWGPLRIEELTLFKTEVFGPYPKYTSLYTRPLLGTGLSPEKESVAHETEGYF